MANTIQLKRRVSGVAGAPGIASTVERRFDFQVREPFAADFQCERENAQSACLPIRPLSLNFNAPVARALAEGIRLSAGGTRLAPVFDTHAGVDAHAWVDSVRFRTVLPENTSFLLELPAGFKDDAGRTLHNAASFPLKVATGPMPPLAKFAAAPFGIVERLADTGWFDRNYLQHLVQAHQDGSRDYSAPLWTLLMFEAFLRNVADAPGAPRRHVQPGVAVPA